MEAQRKIEAYERVEDGSTLETWIEPLPDQDVANPDPGGFAADVKIVDSRGELYEYSTGDGEIYPNRVGLPLESPKVYIAEMAVAFVRDLKLRLCVRIVKPDEETVHASKPYCWTMDKEQGDVETRTLIVQTLQGGH